MDSEVGVVETCGALGLLLGRCAGSALAVLLAVLGGALATGFAGQGFVLSPVAASAEGWVEPLSGASMGLQGQACVALGVASEGAEWQGTQRSGSQLMSGGGLPLALWFTGRLGREVHRHGCSQS